MCGAADGALSIAILRRPARARGPPQGFHKEEALKTQLR